MTRARTTWRIGSWFVSPGVPGQPDSDRPLREAETACNLAADNWPFPITPGRPTEGLSMAFPRRRELLDRQESGERLAGREASVGMCRHRADIVRNDKHTVQRCILEDISVRGISEPQLASAS